jgi:hypothetical protein
MDLVENDGKEHKANSWIISSLKAERVLKAGQSYPLKIEKKSLPTKG